MGKYEEIAARLTALREELQTRRLDGLIVPHADDYQNETLPACAERLKWLTGFTGSAGYAIVLRDKAALFVDGRYTLQAELETDSSLFARFHLVRHPPPCWLSETLKPDTRIGFDPWLHTEKEVTDLRRACTEARSVLVACETNPLDAIWKDRPPPPRTPVVPYPEQYAGETGASKRHRIAREFDADVQVISATDSLAWLFNIRGNDVEHTPLTLARALLYRDGTAELFVDPAKINTDLLPYLGNDVLVRPETDFASALITLGGKSVRVDPAQTPFWIIDRLHGADANVITATDPCQMAKACKNAVELNGMRAAHIRDGASMCRFLAWLERTKDVSEIAAQEYLLELRSEDPLFRGNSFPTISSTGPNAAVIHYHATEESNRTLAGGHLYLVDSGGQYLDGTTDLTRTVPVGADRVQPGDEERLHFTLVLRGMIALSRVVFPRGVSGSQLDVLARRPLWTEGLDYDHGTGHGVGCYLSVHEGPQRISRHPTTVALREGMVISNEPGYYRAGAYGIRIENLLAVVPATQNEMLAFETLTLVPIDRRMIEPGLLEVSERAWFNRYHARVYETIAPLVDEETQTWLKEATRPI